MANDSVIFDPAAPGAAEFSQVQSYLKAANAILNDIKSNLEHQNDGSDFSAAEAYFGIPAGGGQAYYNRIVGAGAEFDAGSINEVTYLYVPSS